MAHRYLLRRKALHCHGLRANKTMLSEGMHSGDPDMALEEMVCRLTCVRLLRAKMDRRGRCKCGSTSLLKLLTLTEVQMQNLRSVLA